jgi:glycosyltransferase involved in cell wall biosynthesis
MIRQLTADGWECHVAVPAPARLAPEYAAAGAVVHIFPMERITATGGPVSGAGRWARYAAKWPLTVLRLWALIRRLGPEVVHSNSLHSWYGWAAARLAGLPHVWHAREIVFQSAGALRLERFLARHFATTVVAVSSAVAAQLEPENVIVVRDDADRTLFGPERAGAFRRAAGLADDARLVGSLARVDVWKGFDVLLDAYSYLQGAGVELVVAGGPVSGKEAYYESLRSRAAGMEGVHWLGPWPARDVPDLMADLDVFAQVSTEPEPYGLVLVEALASGVPVVGGASGGPLDIVTSPEWGRLVPPGDAVALAAGVLELLPSSTSSAARKGRPALGEAPRSDFAAVFEAAASSRRRRGGKRQPGPNRPPTT